jgi:4-deoxy-L-threo-5-hexosulose-uronate ketol-isomerase
MPPHTHLRRSEVYCYFDFPRGGDVKHFLGHPSRVRTLRLREGEAALSPPWSVHSGEGSTHYGFVWGMGGENQDYADMDPVDPKVIWRAR